MINRMEIPNGDMITMAKLVNANTVNMNGRIEELEKFVRQQNKTGTKIAVATGLAIVCLYRISRLTWKTKKLEARVKDLENKKEVDDFLS